MNKSSKLQPIYQLIWYLTHSLMSLLQLIINSLKELVSRNESKNDLINSFNKIPKHIAIAINEELISYKDLVNITKWCQQINVCYLSIFKNNGLNVSRTELEKYFNARSDANKPLTQLKNGYTNGFSNGFNKSQTNGNSKRYLTLDNVNVCILSSEDSHQSLVNAAKHLCTQEEAIDQKDISLYLRKNFDFPDPDLLINFGSSVSLCGYPVWQIRLTEIYFLSTHHDIKINQFCQIISAYSKCEQRFGK